MLIIVVGGQYGGEGKGKVAAYLASRHAFAAVCRCGGVNSSHTVLRGDDAFRLRLVPTACAVSAPKRVIFGAGTLLHIETLLRELALLGIPREAVLIDRLAGVVEESHVREQRRDPRYEELGSTLTGTGYAASDRCLRKLRLAHQFEELYPFLGSASAELTTLLAQGADILVEGHQGFGLSNYHGDYPYCASRDATAAAHLSELGIGPRQPMRIVLVAKVFPTRNHRGRLPGELPPAEIERLGIEEYGGGSWGIPDRRRRVGVIDLDELRRAAAVNTATEIALTGLDYFDPSVRRVNRLADLTASARQLIARVKEAVDIPVTLVSTGPETEAMVELESPPA